MAEKVLWKADEVKERERAYKQRLNPTRITAGRSSRGLPA